MIKGYKIINNMKVPFFVDTAKISAVTPDQRSSQYDHGSNEYVIDVEIRIESNNIIKITEYNSILINGVEIVNDRTENAIKIIDYLMTVMYLEQHENDKAAP